MRLLIFLFFFWTSAAFAQSLPDIQNNRVNDYADLLMPEQQAALTDEIDAFRVETQAEIVVLTLNSLAESAPDLSLEEFATQLFDSWRIDGANQSDGVLVLVLRDDRIMRIELGASYAHDWDAVAQRVVDEYFLPPLRQNDFARGIQQGVFAIMDQIVVPFQDDPDATGPGWGEIYSLWLIVALGLGLALYNGRQRLGDEMARFRNCPNCQQRGLRQSRAVRIPATITYPGTGIRRIQCPHCGYLDEAAYKIPQVPRRYNGHSGTGGGSSGGSSGGGGGASGRF